MQANLWNDFLHDGARRDDFLAQAVLQVGDEVGDLFLPAAESCEVVAVVFGIAEGLGDQEERQVEVCAGEGVKGGQVVTAFPLHDVVAQGAFKDAVGELIIGGKSDARDAAKVCE